MRTIVAALSCALCACSGVTVLRFRPSTTSIPAAVIDHGHSSLPLPARGEAAAASLSDGFPVWVVHHDDDTVSVVSAVAPPKATTTFVGDNVAAQVNRSLASWIPGVRRFYANGIVFDELGHVLGYGDYDGCLGDCPRLEGMPPMLHDLDTFTIESRPESAMVEVGNLVAGQPRQRATTWLPWRRRTARQEDSRAADWPTASRVPLVNALALAEDHYAVIDGETLRSTHAEPVICKSTTRPGSCGACGPERLPLFGIAASDAAHIHSDGWWKHPVEYRDDRRAVYTEVEPGTFLVQRHGPGFRLVAGIFRGICSGS